MTAPKRTHSLDGLREAAGKIVAVAGHQADGAALAMHRVIPSNYRVLTVISNLLYRRRYRARILLAAPSMIAVHRQAVLCQAVRGAVAGLVGIEGDVVSGVFNLESSDVRASDWRPRHDEHYHEA
jgi:hypothetical protein